MSKDKKVAEKKVELTEEEVFIQKYNALCKEHGKTINAETRLMVVDLPKDEDEIKTA